MHKGCKRRGRMGQLARAETGLGTRKLKSWHLARQLCSWRAPTFHTQGVATTPCKSKCKLNALDMELTRSWRMYRIWGWLRSYMYPRFPFIWPF